MRFNLGNFVAGPLVGQEVLAGLVADGLGLGQIPCTKVEGACASGGIAFRHASLAISTGACDVAIAVGVEKMTGADTPTVTAALNCAMDNRADGVSGLTFPGLFGLVWKLHAARYGTTRSDVSSVVRKNKANGLRNPLAQMAAHIDDEAILNSALICDPLRLFDCCPVSDGAAAVLLVSEEVARACGTPMVEVAASVQTRGSARIAGHPDLCSFDATVCGGACGLRHGRPEPVRYRFRRIAMTAFRLRKSWTAKISASSRAGRVAPGHVKGAPAPRVTCPSTPVAGCLRRAIRSVPTGIGQIYETVLQLRGAHPNQVKDAAIGLTHNLGGTGVACTVNILRRSDA